MSGVVYLIGGGPGAPDLITLRGLRLLRAADIVIMDTLLPEDYLDEIGVPGKDVRRIPQGGSSGMMASTTPPLCKEGSDGDDPRQDEINQLMVESALRGLRVARLKGGDPFVFGRGWEEIAVLDEHGIEWEAVPGITSAMAVPAGASVPLTTRRKSRSVAFVTARLAGGSANRQMPKADTLVLLMGWRVLPELVQRLLNEGWPPETPACIIERGCQPGERRVKAPLVDIAKAAQQARFEPPVLVVVGAGIARPDLQTPRPRILFTGTEPAAFRAMGEILHWPACRRRARTISPAELQTALAHLAGEDAAGIVFSDRTAVRRFFEVLYAAGKDVRALHGARLAAWSHGAELALQEIQLCADCACHLADPDILLETLGRPQRALLVQSDTTPTTIADTLRERGVDVWPLPLFDLLSAPRLGSPLPDHDVVYFTHTDAVGPFHMAYGAAGLSRPIWCLNENVAAQFQQLGYGATVVLPPGEAV